MATVAQQIEAGIYALLATDTVLVALLRGGFQEPPIPDGVEAPWVQLAKSAATPQLAMGPVIAIRDYSYDVVGVTYDDEGSQQTWGDRTSTGQAIAQRLETVLMAAKVTVDGAQHVLMLQDEIDNWSQSPTGRGLLHLGGTYRIEVAT